MRGERLREIQRGPGLECGGTARLVAARGEHDDRQSFERRMMPHDAFRSPWKLLAQLFGEFGWISKIGVVNIDILRDDGFDPSADTISRLSLHNPDRPQQFVDVAGLDLRDSEFPIVG